jgi:hypothetical protein
MMREWLDEQIKIKYRDHFMTAKGGIFKTPARQRLMGLAKPYTGDFAQNSQINFWNRIKKSVSNSLVDLALFIEAAPKDKVNDVITFDSIKPVINAYFQLEYGSHVEPSIIKADIAREMIITGFSYLQVHQYGKVPEYERPIINNALEVATSLAKRLKLTIIDNKQELSE